MNSCFRIFRRRLRGDRGRPTTRDALQPLAQPDRSPAGFAGPLPATWLCSLGSVSPRMEPTQALALRSLLESQEIAALATLHEGEPAVSMVPYALLSQGQGFVIHVSRLASHTADMLTSPAVGLLVTAPLVASASPQAISRASIQGTAHQWLDDSPAYSQARALYLSRFPQSEEMFTFSDFSLFVIAVRSARFVGGFAQAGSATGGQFASIMGATS